MLWVLLVRLEMLYREIVCSEIVDHGTRDLFEGFDGITIGARNRSCAGESLKDFAELRALLPHKAESVAVRQWLVVHADIESDGFANAHSFFGVIADKAEREVNKRFSFRCAAQRVEAAPDLQVADLAEIPVNVLKKIGEALVVGFRFDIEILVKVCFENDAPDFVTNERELGRIHPFGVRMHRQKLLEIR